MAAERGTTRGLTAKEKRPGFPSQDFGNVRIVDTERCIRFWSSVTWVDSFVLAKTGAMAVAAVRRIEYINISASCYQTPLDLIPHPRPSNLRRLA